MKKVMWVVGPNTPALEPGKTYTAGRTFSLKGLNADQLSKPLILVDTF